MAEHKESTPLVRALERRYQVHFWIAERDYRLLRSIAREEEETISRILRRLIRGLRRD
jgi:hypothetical protein